MLARVISSQNQYEAETYSRLGTIEVDFLGEKTEQINYGLTDLFITKNRPQSP